jgi:hypothetical protein
LNRRHLDTVSRGTTPLEFLLSVMCDPGVDTQRRDKAAIAALPYYHAKMERPQKLGKKEAAEMAAEQAGAGSEWGDDLTPTQ